MFHCAMPPKPPAQKAKSGGGKPPRKLHANETVAKHLQPGHGAVARAQGNDMWTETTSFMEPPSKGKKSDEVMLGRREMCERETDERSYFRAPGSILFTTIPLRALLSTSQSTSRYSNLVRP